MAAISSLGTREAIEKILDKETRIDSDFRLCIHMGRRSLDDNEADLALKLLKQLQLGLTEKK